MVLDPAGTGNSEQDGVLHISQPGGSRFSEPLSTYLHLAEAPTTVALVSWPKRQWWVPPPTLSACLLSVAKRCLPEPSVRVQARRRPRLQAQCHSV